MASMTSALASLLFAMLATGFAFMALEILFLRELLITLGGTIYASSATLASVMFGLFAGSQAFGYASGRVRDATLLLAAIELALAGTTVLLLPALRWLGEIESWHARYALSFLLILVPSALVGGEIPVAMQALERHIPEGRTGFYAGLVYGADTLGALIGALALPFAMLPTLGAYQASLLAGAANALGGMLLLRGNAWRNRPAVLAGTGILATLAVFGSSAVGAALDQASLLRASPGLRHFLRQGTLKSHYLEESPYQRIEIAEVDAGAGEPIRWLALDGELQSSDGALRDYGDIIDFALLSHPSPKRVLVIGCGDGNNIASALADERIERLDQVEIDAQVVEATRKRIPSINTFREKSVWEDPRVRLFIGDGRQFLTKNHQRYDVIFCDLPHAAHEGASVFYTLEFMRLARERLEPGGIFLTHVHWPASEGGLEERLAALLITARTAREAFGPSVHILSPLLWPAKREFLDHTFSPVVMASVEPLDTRKDSVAARLARFNPEPWWLGQDRYLRWTANSYLPDGLSSLPVSTDDRPAILFPRLWTRSGAVRAMSALHAAAPREETAIP